VSDLGGDPACWLDRVCDDCGGFLADDGPHTCRPTIPVERPPAP
jgi:hypothetical protein